MDHHTRFTAHGSWYPVLWLFLIILVVAGLSLISLHLPLGRDQGVAAYFGGQILEGKVVYRDLYHFNFPGIFYTYALALKLFGLKPEAINLFDLIFRLFTLAGIYLAGARLFGKPSGLWAAGIYGIFSTVVYNNYWQNAQKETFALGALVYCLYFFSLGLEAGKWKKPWIFLAGIFGFWAMLYKPTVALAPGLMGLFLLLDQGRGIKERGMGILGFGLGLILPAIIVAIYFQSRHALSEMIRQVFIFGTAYGGQYYSGGPKVFGLIFWKIVSWMIDFGFLVGFAILGMTGLIREKKQNWKLPFWFGLGLFLNLLIQLKFFTYHFMVLLLPLAIFSGAFFGAELDKLFPAQNRPARAGIWILALFLFSANLKSDFSRYGRELLYDLGRISKDDFLEKYGKWGFGDLSVTAEYQVSRYLREQTGPEEKVLVFGLEPGINFLAQRKAPGKFSYDLPLTYQFGSEKFQPYQNQLRKQFLSELNSGAPAYIVVVEKDTSAIEPKDSFDQMLAWVEFKSFLAENYFLETKIEHYYLYRKK